MNVWLVTLVSEAGILFFITVVHGYHFRAGKTEFKSKLR